MGCKQWAFDRIFVAGALGEDLTGCIGIDVFAGSGIVGREMARRGAIEVVTSEAAAGPRALLRMLSIPNGTEHLHRHASLFAQGYIEAEGAAKHYYDMRAGLNRAIERGDEDVVAAIWLVLSSICFNGLWRVNRAGDYNVPMGKRRVKGANKPQVARVSSLADLEAAAALTQRTTIFRDWRETLQFVEDRAAAYAVRMRGVWDPPYHGSEVAYVGAPFTDEDRAEGAERIAELCSLGARFVVHDSLSAESFYMDAAADTCSIRCYHVPARASVSRDAKQRGQKLELLAVLS